MTDQAWAVLIAEVNFPAILSEAGKKFDREFLERWFAQEGEGYFVRDKSSALDCSLFNDLEFFRHYQFANKDVDALFREIEKLG